MIFTPPTFLTRRKVETRTISDEQWQAMIAPAVHSMPYGGPERRYQRRATHLAIMHLHLESAPRGEPDRYLVRTRNLSDTGVGFIHSEAIPPGTRCQIALLDLEHQLVRRRGVVACSAECEERLHHVGLRFDEPINPTDFVMPEPPPPDEPRIPA